ncbi:MAG: c-type cytochrome [Alphaproteobacteria bacterium]
MTAWSKRFMSEVVSVAALASFLGLGAFPGWVPAAVAQEKAADAAASAEEEVDWEDKPYEMVDGKIDFGTYNGFRRYHASCHVCHGPDGLGSSYAPALVDSVKRIGYDGYLDAVVNGLKDVNQAQQLVMPSFGEDPNVMNYVDDIYAYLKARADGVLGRGRPDHLPKPKDG